MKIVFIIEYFFPFDKGGSEWSTYYLARDLVKKGHEVTIITPNYGGKKKEVLDGIKLIRTPFYKKIKNFNIVPGNFFFTNPLFIIWNTLVLYLYLQREKPTIVNIHGKYSVPSVRLANIFLRIPLTATIRDYIVICNYGMCLLKSNKSCNIKDYFTKDFPVYCDLYVNNKNFINYFANIIFSVWGRFSTNILRYSLKGINLTMLSPIQEEIFNTNGFKNTQQIYNSLKFTHHYNLTKKEDIFIYAGRLTPGKGVGMLVNILPELIESYPKYQFIFVGDGVLKTELNKIASENRNIKILGNISHKKLLKLFSKAKVSLAPANWPEPFGRVVIESISCGTPVIVGERAGLANIINGKWGIAIDPNKKNVIDAIKTILKNDYFYNQIKKDYNKISNTFSDSVTNKYLTLYETLIK